ncbi:uncharacterized protein TNCV_3976541 [Trichonephila clavipes]|nr:uncharacterized protein TNCV_3976541 [Trichonephila clavipes]
MCLIEDETFNDMDIINNLIDYEDGQEKLDSLRADKIYSGIWLSNKSKKNFPKTDINSERSLKFRKELRHAYLVITTFHKELTKRPSSQKLLTY